MRIDVTNLCLNNDFPPGQRQPQQEVSIDMDRKDSKRISKKPLSKVTRNPFLNFIRDFRSQNHGLKSVEIVKKAGEAWRKMTDVQRQPYSEMAKQCRRRRHKRGGRRRRRRGRRHSDYEDESQSEASYDKDED